MSINTGNLVFGTLTQVYTDTGVDTGETKSNDPTDPDYIAPIKDTVDCPPPNVPVPSNNKLQIQFINNTNQGIALDSVIFKGFSIADLSKAYINGTTSLLPNTTTSKTFIQLDTITASQFLVKALTLGIRMNLTIQYKEATDSSFTIIETLLLGSNIDTYFPTPTESGTGTNILQFVFTPNPVINPVYILPTVDAGVDRIITLPTNSLSIEGDATANGATIVSILWTQLSGPYTATIGSPNTLFTTFTNLFQGVYIFQLTVTDSNGSVGIDTVQVTVNAILPNPNGTVLMYVDANMPDADESIVQVSLRPNPYSGSSLIDLLESPLINSSGVLQVSPLKGIYDIVVQLTLTSGPRSLNVNWSTGSVFINIPQSGTYVISGVIVDEGSAGVVIDYNSTPVEDPTFPILFAKLIVNEATSVNIPTLPNGLTIVQTGNIEVDFYLDNDATTPEIFTGQIDTKLIITNNLDSSTLTKYYINEVSDRTYIISSNQRTQIYDYNLGDSPIQDSSYNYTLLVGQGYLIIT